MALTVCPMIQVADVARSSGWYQSALGLVSGHGGDEFEMLFAAEPFQSRLLLQLHRWEAHEHGFLGQSDQPVGNGSSLWFETDDRPAFDIAVQRAKDAGATVLEGPAWNPIAHHFEMTMQDIDGYVVVLCSPFAPTPD
jgi:catechol 2,3-dioxygenase-like lactoylglutathione lyase family enzyme